MDGMSWVGSFSDVLGDWLEVAVEAGLYAGLLAMVVLAINVLFRRWLSAGQMALLWGLVLLRLVILFAPDSSLSYANLLMSAKARPANALAAARPVEAAEVAPQHSIPENVRQLTDLRLATAAPDAMQELYWVEAPFLAMPLVWVVGGGAGLAYT